MAARLPAARLPLVSGGVQRLGVSSEILVERAGHRRVRGKDGRREQRMKYRKKPVVVEAVQWTGDNLAEMEAFVSPEAWGGTWWSEAQTLRIKTLEGEHRALLGDFIIRGVKGEFYPCKPDIFEKTYEPAGESEA